MIVKLKNIFSIKQGTACQSACFQALAQPLKLPYSRVALMFAVVQISGFQEKVSEGQTLSIPLQDAKEGDSVRFDRVLLLSDGGNVSVGAPYLSGASVSATVLRHGKTDKIRIQKFERRKRYRRVKGHRQDFTEVTIGKITA